ncbi:hypothetical protein F5890DRAFT_1564667 [Lentinula detonsa]|uniref:Uncharacterized protein n=1 Tax=Lentinula detonsa TaxID=2804962 RepID=A0AA38Q1F9_9AGAR|nr:hypothetical protein F5890DRAFT_1564667 [Lentinula detonsa]
MTPSEHTSSGVDSASNSPMNFVSDDSNDPDVLTLPDLHFSYRKTSVALYIAFLIICNVLIPCLLFYLLQTFTKITTKELIGISSAALGLSSCFDAPFRLFRLVRHRTTYGPLGTDVWWHLDFVMWTYTFALLVFAFPLAIAPAIAFYNFFLMSTMMLVGPVGVVFIFSLIAYHYKWRLPVRCSSEPVGSLMKPAVFYCIEDVGAVDFMHGRKFRQRVHTRYDASPPFRQLMTELTVYWVICGAIYCGLTATVTWAATLNFAFGWVLGQFFIWAFLSWIGCHFLARRGLERERAYWDNRGRTLFKEKTGPGGINEGGEEEKPPKRSQSAPGIPHTNDGTAPDLKPAKSLDVPPSFKPKAERTEVV